MCKIKQMQQHACCISSAEEYNAFYPGHTYNVRIHSPSAGIKKHIQSKIFTHQLVLKSPQFSSRGSYACIHEIKVFPGMMMYNITVLTMYLKYINT